MRDHFIVLVTTVPSLHTATRDLATRLAGRANAVLLFMHVVPFRQADGEAMLHAAVDVAHGASQAWLRAQRPSDSGVRYRHRLESGEPEEVVARFVRDQDVDLVIAEEPPRNWLSEALWRGLAERLIRRVNCPVVVSGPGFLRTAHPIAPPERFPLATATVADLLNATVEARVDALRCWMDQASDAVQRIAASTTVQGATQRTARGPSSLDAHAEQRLRVELDEHRRALRAIGWQLSLGQTVWTDAPLRPTHGRTMVEFLDRVRRSGHSTSLPMTAEDGSARLLVLAGASVADGQGTLFFAFDAEVDFLRILGQPGPLPSFETYAFDDEGLMLSHSQFPHHLVEAGLLDAEGDQTPLHLRIVEPSAGPVEQWPLTLMAREATRQRDGFNTRGYMDYRGKRVVGAWRWIPEYGFGVTAEIDRLAAFG